MNTDDDTKRLLTEIRDLQAELLQEVRDQRTSYQWILKLGTWGLGAVVVAGVLAILAIAATGAVRIWNLP